MAEEGASSPGVCVLLVQRLKDVVGGKRVILDVYVIAAPKTFVRNRINSVHALTRMLSGEGVSNESVSDEQRGEEQANPHAHCNSSHWLHAISRTFLGFVRLAQGLRAPPR